MFVAITTFMLKINTPSPLTFLPPSLLPLLFSLYLYYQQPLTLYNSSAVIWTLAFLAPLVWEEVIFTKCLCGANQCLILKYSCGRWRHLKVFKFLESSRARKQHHNLVSPHIKETVCSATLLSVLLLSGIFLRVSVRSVSISSPITRNIFMSFVQPSMPLTTFFFFWILDLRAEDPWMDS